MINRQHTLLIANAVFWVILLGLVLADFSLTVFGKQIRPEAVLALLLLPPLVTWSWHTTREMQASRAKRYLLAIQMMGLLFWILVVCLEYMGIGREAGFIL
jgi:hypothetical protein